MFVTQKDILSLVKVHSKYLISTDCRLVHAKMQVPETETLYPSLFQKSLIKRTIQISRIEQKILTIIFRVEKNCKLKTFTELVEGVCGAS